MVGGLIFVAKSFQDLEAGLGHEHEWLQHEVCLSLLKKSVSTKLTCCLQNIPMQICVKLGFLERSKEIYKAEKTDQLLHTLTMNLLNYLSIVFTNLLIKFPFKFLSS